MFTLPKGFEHQDSWQYWPPFMIRDDPKLSDDNGEVPKPDKVIGGEIFGNDIVSLLDGKTSQVVKTPHVFPKKKRKKERKRWH